MSVALELAAQVGLAPACQALGVPRATLYRHLGPRPVEAPRVSPRALSPQERNRILEVLHADRFRDLSAAEVYATLLDEGVYLGSIRTLYRVLDAAGEVKERRRQARRPKLPPPQLVATGPNQVWTWDITVLRGPDGRIRYFLYVILDLFSRYVVGWMLAEAESATLAERFIAETLDKHSIPPGQLKLHADRGAAMKSKTVAQLLGDLGVTKTHSRPRTSNDNAFSESQFKTVKHNPWFPGRFGSLEDARAYCRAFFRWYNHEHRHWGIALLTPAQVYRGETDGALDARQQVLERAHARHPHRFVKGRPKVARPPAEVWINPPERVLAGSPDPGEHDLSCSPTKPPHPGPQRGHSPDGPPAQAGAAGAEGVDGLDGAKARVNCLELSGSQ